MKRRALMMSAVLAGAVLVPLTAASRPASAGSPSGDFTLVGPMRLLGVRTPTSRS